MDRNFIEGRTFPTARKGLDPEAVRAHLRSVADAVEEATRTAPPTTAASQAADQVRGIVEAAENSADAIVTRAQGDADELLSKARAQAQATRDRAAAAAAKHLEDVEAAGKRLQERADATEADFESMLANLRTAGDGLLERVRGGAGEIQGRIEAILGTLPSIVADWDDEDEPDEADDHSAAEDDLELDELGDEGDDEDEDLDVAEVAPAGDDGARMVALNMALSGTPRDETATYLADNYELADADSLLDDVYARVS
ncbi:MAG: hypothetical protein QOG62_2023 [Thermoleophilaceae bacterium]|jgi:hypothetical protein|nr:hypothetical protein [Thermoleophilaceae bacterium]